MSQHASFLRGFLALFHFPDADGKIRAVQLAPPAAGAAFGFIHHRGALGIQAQALPRAEGGADAAGLAPVPVDVDSILGVAAFRGARRRREPYLLPGPDPVLSPNLPLDPLIGSPSVVAAGFSLRFILLPFCFCRRGFGGTLLLIKSRVPPNSLSPHPLTPPLTRGCASENCAAG